jgi:hypothetical protein
MLVADYGEIPLRDVCFLQHQDSFSSVGISVHRYTDESVAQDGL